MKSTTNTALVGQPMSNSQLLARLTPTETAILAQIAQGMRNKAIAIEREVAVRTIETHREHIMNKLGINNIAQLTQFALATNLIRNQYAGN